MLSAPPQPSQQTQVLLHAIAAEQQLIWVYAKVTAAYSVLAATLAPLRAEHEAHLAQLRARVVEPPGRQAQAAVTAGPSTTGSPTTGPLIAGTQAAALAQLRAAEQAAVTAQMDRLAAAPAALAQLYASIAACESTHVSVLAARISTR